MIINLDLRLSTPQTCVYLLLKPYKVKHYIDQMTPVYTCLFDACLVFDRVNHWTCLQS